MVAIFKPPDWFVVFLKPPLPFSIRHQLLLAIQFVVIPKPLDSKSTFSHQQLDTSRFELPTFRYHLSHWTQIHPFRLRGGGCWKCNMLWLLTKQNVNSQVCAKNHRDSKRPWNMNPKVTSMYIYMYHIN